MRQDALHIGRFVDGNELISVDKMESFWSLTGKRRVKCPNARQKDLGSAPALLWHVSRRGVRMLGFPHSLTCASFYSHHAFCEKVDNLFGVTSNRS